MDYNSIHIDNFYTFIQDKTRSLCRARTKMLKEVDQNLLTHNSMGSPVADSPDGAMAIVQAPELPTRGSLAIHNTNVFQPHKLTITCMAESPTLFHMATRRGYLCQTDVNHPFSQLDIYDIRSKHEPKHMLTMFAYEDVTGLAWLDHDRFITVSKQSTINVYSVRSGQLVKTYTSDYGPITCMRYTPKKDLLVTGTEYGYAVAYKVNDTIECFNKMVKLSEPINSIDFHLQEREVPVKEAVPAKKTKPAKAKKPGKRKRAESSDESEDEEEEEEEGDAETTAQDVFMANTDVTIFGACDNKVVAWDYHRKTIVDTVITENQVCSLLALDNGDFAIGDSEGYLNIHDKNTFTCRQSERILKSNVTCLATDPSNSFLVAAGKEPIITILKPKVASETEHEYILGEQIRDHSAQINGALCLSKKVFYTCSQDNTIMKFRLHKSDRRQELRRYVTRDNHRSRIHWSSNELMLTHGKSLHIYQIGCDTQFRSELAIFPTQQLLEVPPRVCSIKATIIVHAAALDDKWICYSTMQGTTIIDRPGLSRVGVPTDSLPACHLMKLCNSGKFLVAAQRTILQVTCLDNELTPQTDNEEPDATTTSLMEVEEAPQDEEENGQTLNGKETQNGSGPLKYQTIMQTSLRGYIQKILYHEHSNRLLVACGTSNLTVYVCELPTTTPLKSDKRGKFEHHVKRLGTSKMLCDASSHLAINNYDESDTNLYIFTHNNELIRSDFKSKAFSSEGQQRPQRVTGVPKGAGILGLIILSRRFGLIYDNYQLYKVDMDSHEIVNTTSSYNGINVVCDTIFDRQDEILIV